MMKKMKLALAVLLLLITVLGPVSKASAENTNSNFYTYSYDYFGDEMHSPNAYTADSVLFGSALGEEIGNFFNPSSLYVRDNLLYIVDTGNSRIVVVDGNLNLIRIIDRVMLDGQESMLLRPQDIFVASNGDFYICDTDNYRVLHTDNDLNVIKVITKPEDETILEDSNFIPRRTVVDTAGRIYVLAANVNKGLMEFDVEGNFVTYMGANQVNVSFMEVLRKRLMTKEQRERMVQFVPTEYSNIAIDSENFIFATTNTFTTNDLNTLETVKPIRKLNSLGNDILVNNGYFPPVGDVMWGTGGDISGPSRFEDITAMENDTYFAIDRNRGRIFGYDFQGNMLFAFGGTGNRKGYFLYPVSIEHMGTDLYVLDNRAATVTKFTLTEYGELINRGLALYKEGKYDESADYWREVARLNTNYDLAYIGIGRSLLRQGEYEEAMKYFESKRDTNNYSKAFAEYRKEWVEDNIGKLIAGAVVLLLLPSVIRTIKKLIKGGVRK